MSLHLQFFLLIYFYFIFPKASDYDKLDITKQEQ